MQTIVKEQSVFMEQVVLSGQGSMEQNVTKKYSVVRQQADCIQGKGFSQGAEGSHEAGCEYSQGVQVVREWG